MGFVQKRMKERETQKRESERRDRDIRYGESTLKSGFCEKEREEHGTGFGEPE